MQPYLKSKKEGGASSGPDPKIERKPDEDKEMDMLDAVAADILRAVSAGDHKMLRDALESLVDHIQYQDEIKDQQEFGA